MIKFLLPVILLFMFSGSFAQTDTVRKYLDAELHFTSKKNFVYAALAIKNNDHWVLYAVYPDTAVLLRVYFKDAALTIKDGPFALYYPKKIMAESGYYNNGVAGGHWQSWYPGGQIKNDGNIINNHFSGIWKAWYRDGKMMSERSYVYKDSGSSTPVHQNSPVSRLEKVLDEFSPEGELEGACNTWYENGNKESVTNYHNDSLAGNCAWFRENGQPSSKELYVNGKVTALECYDTAGKLTGSSCSILKLPLLIHPFLSAQDYIVNELHKDRNRDIKQEGDAELSFTVTKNGTLENLVIASSPDPALSKHITRIVAAMPAWSPAVTHNRVIDYPVKLVIPYYRD